MRCPVITRAALCAPEQRRSSARRLSASIVLLCATCLVTALPLGAVRANDEPNPALPAALSPTKPPATAATATPPVVPVQAFAVAPPPAPAAPPNPTAGLTVIGEGGAAYYSPGYDGGGWDAIIRTHMRGGQGNPVTFPYSPDGYYCVHPDFVFGNILTLQNMDTGKTIRCTVADAVAPWDQGYWRNRFVIEISYALFAALGLDRGNHVRVLAMQ